ncbi:hypothetical protein [Streptomyces sp. NPDC018000]|uniref:hypothetical protein n=1 Tax=Streptomyces sp. NPDC018000 TaxID=3365028 RepID=UPI00379BFE46
MATEDHDEKPTASGDDEGARQKPPGTDEAEYARQAEEHFIDDLIACGAAVPEGEELPPRATHVISYDEEGRRTVRRVRFAGHHPPSKE